MKILGFMKLLLVFLLVFSLSNRAYATETRVASMGGIGYFIQDNTNIFYFPGTLAQYSNQLNIEARQRLNVSTYTAGVHLPFNSMVFAVYLNRPVNVIPAANLAGLNVRMDNTTDFLGAFRVGKMGLGVRLSLGMDSYKDENVDPTLTENATYIGLGFGLSYDIFDMGADIDIPLASAKAGDDKMGYAGFGFGFNGRANFQASKELQIVPVALLYLAPAGYTVENAAGTQTDESYLSFRFGLAVGLNYSINENNLLTMAIEALGYNRSSWDEKDVETGSESTFTFPGIYLGVESKIKPWLIGRLGAAQVFQSISETTKPDGGDEATVSTRDSQYDVTFGLGIVLGNFVFDLAINEGLLFDGPNFISGSNESVSNRLSVSYSF